MSGVTHDDTTLISIIADIREKSGVGAKPMLGELADAIALALSQAYERGQESQWQDIETAPKDGTIILLCRATGKRAPEVYPGAWCPDETEDAEYPWLFWERLNIKQVKPNGWANGLPTHWMPLPVPPAIRSLPIEQDSEVKG